MLMLLILLAVLIVMMAYGFYRHWKAQIDKTILDKGHRLHRINRRRP